jgi:NADH-quinone oxidoreductase subunit E
MAVRRLAEKHLQPPAFAFDAGNAEWANGQIAKYPAGRQASAVIPLLWRAQEQCGGWLPEAAIRTVADMLGMAHIRVLEVATFYTMFNLAPVGTHFVQVCGTTPCALRGAEAIKKICKKRFGDERHVTPDGKFSWLEVECLGACVNAPMVQVNFDYYEDLTPESFEALLDDLAAGKPVRTGPQTARQLSAPEGGATTLTDATLFDGSRIGAWRKRFEEGAAAAPAPAAPAASAAPTPIAAAPPVPVAPAASKPQTVVSAPAPAAAPPVAVAAAPPVAAVPSSGPAPAGSAGSKPVMLTAARDGKPDDLELIWGVGPKLAAMLNRMGVFHFDQIAAWTAENLVWVDQNLEGFKGRASRDKWIDQAKKLATGWRPESQQGDRPV